LHGGRPRGTKSYLGRDFSLLLELGSDFLKGLLRMLLKRAAAQAGLNFDLALRTPLKQKG